MRRLFSSNTLIILLGSPPSMLCTPEWSRKERKKRGGKTQSKTKIREFVTLYINGKHKKKIFYHSLFHHFNFILFFFRG